MNIRKRIYYKITKARASSGYIHIPKTGGTYINQVETDGKQVIWPFWNIGHTCVVENVGSSIYPPSAGILKTISMQEISNYKIFSVVRNIFSWLVSYAGHAGGWNPKYVDKSHYDYDVANKGFDYLLKTIAEREDPWPCRKFIFFQLFSDQGHYLPDLILRTETLDFDLAKHRGVLNVRYKKKDVQRKGYHEDYRSYYTDGLIDLVGKTWRRELELYGYNFDGCDLEKAIIKNIVSIKEKNNIHYSWETDIFRCPR